MTLVPWFESIYSIIVIVMTIVLNDPEYIQSPSFPCLNYPIIANKYATITILYGSIAHFIFIDKYKNAWR